MTTRKRIDVLLVERGLFESRARAQAAIAAGLVTADGVPVAKASDPVSDTAELSALPAHPWVSRGGLKLAAALDHFGIEVSGQVCLDVGSSTGGFTDVLLARGAHQVIAVDVGTSQLHARLRGDARVVSLENCDIRTLVADRMRARPSLIAVDVSFISLRLVLPPALALATRPAALVALIKPQFESPGRRKRGIVRDAALQQAVCDEIATQVASLGWTVAGTIPSPIAGGDGNREFLLYATRA
jgi:23S rRNA (cytidine1920-2'-O)/16S rRNA (cytidine1409-2'-O)-methyltransferase